MLEHGMGQFSLSHRCGTYQSFARSFSIKAVQALQITHPSAFL